MTLIPVSCLEAGRWDQGGAFAVDRPVDYRLRAQLAQQVDAGARAEAAAPGNADQARSYRSDQGAIWSEIGAREARAGIGSTTSPLHDLYRHEAAELASLVGAFPYPVGAAGIAVAIGGHYVALELFDAPDPCAQLWPSLVTAAASAALDHRRATVARVLSPPAHRYPDQGSLRRLLGRASDSLAHAIAAPSVGKGTDLRFRGSRVVGSALLIDGRAVHVEAFRLDD